MNTRISPVVKAAKFNHGANFSVQRLDLERLGDLVYPVVGFDHFEIAGPTFAPHPHAGFSAVSYVFDDSPGALRNRDSLGHDVLVEPGDLLWTQAGNGVIHDEFPAKRGKVVHGLQLFVNVGRNNKHLAPQMFHAHVSDIPVFVDPRGNQTKVLTGSYAGMVSRIEPVEPFDLFDLNLRSQWDWQVAPGRSLMVYVLEGHVKVSTSSGTHALDRNEAIGLRNGDASLDLSISPAERAHLLVLSGTDPQEPLAIYGPFIMNTQRELEQAFDRYRNGDMGRLTPLAAAEAEFSTF
jgi:redox-sensitive bicupin YhaK (pirin superfamily)